MKRIVVSFGLLAALVLLSTTVMARPGGYGPGSCGGPGGYRGAGPDGVEQRGFFGAGMQRMAVILDLSSEQQEQIKEMQARHWEAREQLREKLWSSRDDFRGGPLSEEFDADAYREQVRKHADLKAEMMIQRAESHQAMLDILTEEQRDKFQQLWGQRTAAGFRGSCGGYQACPGDRGDHHWGRGAGFKRGGRCS